MKTVLTIDKKGLAALTSSFFATMKALFSKADVVHYHSEGPCAWMWIIKWFSRKRVIATIHGLDWQRAKWSGFAAKYIKYGERVAVKYADEIIVLSKNVQDYFKKNYHRKTVFISNGVSKPKIEDAKIIKEKYHLEKNSYILFLGRIVPEKGIHYLIDAYCQIKTDKKLVIAGAASDTDGYYHKLKEMAKNNENIIFTGFIQGRELGELYSNAYLYCLFSPLEDDLSLGKISYNAPLISKVLKIDGFFCQIRQFICCMTETEEVRNVLLLLTATKRQFNVQYTRTSKLY